MYSMALLMCFIIYAAVVVAVDAGIIYSMALLHYLCFIKYVVVTVMLALFLNYGTVSLFILALLYYLFYRTALLCILWHC